MNIAIITLPLSSNYGGILQAYALQKVLQGMGHQTTTFDTDKTLHINRLTYPVHILARLIFRCIGKWDAPLLYEYALDKEFKEITQYTLPFVYKHIHIRSFRDLNFSEVKEFEYDAFVVGSDQVWRPKMGFGDRIPSAFLDFTSSWSVKRLSYAASFGSEEWEYSPNTTGKCAKLVQKFNGVSVREKNGVTLCRRHFNVDAEHVLDPTLLLQTSDYKQLIAKETGRKRGIMTYILDESEQKQAIIDKARCYLKMDLFKVNGYPYDRSKSMEERIQPPVEEWIQGFIDANFVITDSFHACVFSILFHKPFIVIGNQERGLSRIQSLLDSFDLESRMLLSIDDCSDIIANEIEWENIENRLSELRIKSMEFLSNSLN